MSDSCFIFEKKEIDTFDIELLIKKTQNIRMHRVIHKINIWHE